MEICDVYTVKINTFTIVLCSNICVYVQCTTLCYKQRLDVTQMLKYTNLKQQDY